MRSPLTSAASPKNVRNPVCSARPHVSPHVCTAGGEATSTGHRRKDCRFAHSSSGAPTPRTPWLALRPSPHALLALFALPRPNAECSVGSFYSLGPARFPPMPKGLVRLL